MIKQGWMISCIFFLSFFSVSHAMTVHDPAVFAKIIQEIALLKKQLAELKHLKEQGMDQLKQAKRIVRDAEGHYKIGGLLNQKKDLLDRQWSPEKWSDSLQAVSGGNIARYQQLVKQYEASHPTLNRDDYQKGQKGDLKNEDYQSQIAVNRAATVGATAEYDNIHSHLSTIYDLSNHIETTQNSKAAQDLIARMNAEIAYTNVAMLRQLVYLNHQLAQFQSTQIAQQTAASQFNTFEETEIK